MPKTSLWINARDFLKTTFQISIKNVTTHTEVSSSASVEIVEVNDSGIILKLPRNVGASGHFLLIHIVRKYGTGDTVQETPFDFTGKITAVEPLSADSNSVALQFYQFNENQWKTFLEQCDERQKAVNQIIKRVQE